MTRGAGSAVVVPLARGARRHAGAGPARAARPVLAFAAGAEHPLRRAEKRFRQGLLSEAIELYEGFVAGQPRQWRAVGTLGDLLVRAGRSAEAVERFVALAAHYRVAAPEKCALACRKIIALSGEVSDESVRALLVTWCTERGHVDRARNYATRADEWRTIAEALFSRGRTDDAVAALGRALAANPSDHESRVRLARHAWASGDVQRARSYLPPEADHPVILECRLEVEAAAGDANAVRAIAARLLKADRANVRVLLSLASTAQGEPAFQCLDVATDALSADCRWDLAASSLEAYVARFPHDIPALMKLVEVCVDGDLGDLLRRAQTSLADAYLRAGCGREARVIAEDLALEDPDDPANTARFRRAVELLGEPDPDGFVEECLRNAQPFVDFDLVGREPAPAAPPVEPEPELPRESPLERALRLEQAGRADEAISILQEARDVEHGFDATLLLARIHRERGRNLEAAEWFEHARQEAPTPADAAKVLYELGIALAAAGESERALAVFIELGRTDPALGRGPR